VAFNVASIHTGLSRRFRLAFAGWSTLPTPWRERRAAELLRVCKVPASGIVVSASKLSSKVALRLLSWLLQRCSWARTA
jgi:hypothetical protein